MEKIFKLKIFYIILVIVILISGYAFYETIYLDSVSKINLEVNLDTLEINVFDNMKQVKYKATFRDKDITKLVKIENNVDTSKVGEYKIIYTVDYKNKKLKKEKTVKVVDKVIPEIKLNGESEIEIFEGDNYEDKLATASDNYDLDITNKITTEGSVDINQIGEYIITYNVEDSSGNKNSITRKVVVKKRPRQRGIAVLNYHFFYSDGEYCGEGICLNTRKFEEQLSYLQKEGYKTLTMDEFVKWMYGEISVPEKSVLLTIDDGAMGTGFHNGNKLIPLLEKYNAHATLFLITGWWDIGNYKSNNLDVESHTNDMHTAGVCSNKTRGAKILCSSDEKVMADLKKSIEITNSNKAFCYPFYAYDSTAIEQVKRAGFKVAFAGGSVKATRDSNKYAIPRYPIYDSITLQEFINYIS